MIELKIDYLRQVIACINDGDMEGHFLVAEEEGRYAILDFLETLMEAGEAADQVATKVIFKGSMLEQLAGVSAHSQRPGGSSEPEEK